MKLFISQLIDETDYLKIIAKENCGLEIIDFSIAEVLDNPSDYLKKYKSPQYQDLSLGLHGPFFDLIPATFDSLIKEVTLRRFNQVYDIAKELNAKYLVFHTGYLKDVYHYEAWLANSITFWQDFLNDKDDSIQIYIENVFEDEYYYLKELVKTINKPYFNICLDLGHANIRNSYDLKEWLYELKDYIRHLHFHNNDGRADLHQGLNNGEINYNEILNIIAELKIEASITLELANAIAITDSITLLKQRRTL